MNNSIEIAHITIQQDEKGRYCLNDLHAASGGDKRNQPSNFFRLDQTAALVNELLTPQIRGVKPVEKTELFA